MTDLNVNRISPTDASSLRYQLRDSSVFHFGEGWALVCPKACVPPQLLPARVVNLLARCERFATLEQHALDFLRSALPYYNHQCGEAASLLDRAATALLMRSPKATAILEQLRNLAGAGLLISESDVLGALGRVGEPDATPPTISVIGIPTRDRLKSLIRTAKSCIDDCRRYERAPELVVTDMSSPCVQEEARRALQTLAKKGVRILYVGQTERAAYSKRLLEIGGFPPEVIHFCLFHGGGCGIHPQAAACLPTHGACRNALLLHTVGELSLCVDDDTVCSIRALPDTLPGVAFSSEAWPVELWFPPDPAALVECIPDAGRSVLQLHEQMLGRSVQGFAAASQEDLILDSASPRLIRKLFCASGMIAMTSLGVVGDCGFGLPSPYLTLAGDSRNRLTVSRDEYVRAISTRRVIMAARRATISDSTFCMAINLGIDNRTLLPPFMPVLRNEDGIFRYTLELCCDGKFSGFLPWVLIHDPLTPRSFQFADLWESTLPPRSCDLVLFLIQSFTRWPSNGSVPDKLRALGKFLCDVASVPPADFEEVLRTLVLRAAGLRVTAMERMLGNAGEMPAFWAADVKKHIATIRERLTSSSYLTTPWDLPGTPGDAQKLLRRLMFLFGHLLVCWPDIVEVARVLRSNGHGLGKEILQPR